MRELYIREGQLRSQRFGAQLWPILVDNDGERPAARQAARTEELSEYEKQRNANILANQAALRALFGTTDVVKQQRDERAKQQKERRQPRHTHAAARPADAPPARSLPPQARAPKPAQPASRVRASGRLATKPAPRYVAAAVRRGSDDEGDCDEEGARAEKDPDASGGESDDDDDDDDDDGWDTDDDGDGEARKPKAKKAKGGKAKAKEEGKPKVKRVRRAGGSIAGSVPPGGRGLVCPHDGCDEVFDDEKALFEHAQAEHGIAGREVEGRGVDEQARQREDEVLWDGCGKLMKIRKQASGSWNFYEVRNHEAKHEKGGPPPTGFRCPECDASYDTLEAVWAHMEEHPCEVDKTLCLWAGCGRRFGAPTKLRRHEPVHTGVWPHTCDTCGRGHQHGVRRSSRRSRASPACIVPPAAPPPQPGGDCCKGDRRVQVWLIAKASTAGRRAPRPPTRRVLPPRAPPHPRSQTPRPAQSTSRRTPRSAARARRRSPTTTERLVAAAAGAPRRTPAAAAPTRPTDDRTTCERGARTDALRQCVTNCVCVK